MSLQQYAFQSYPCSLLAASIVAASRRAVRLDPIWSDELSELTGYNHAYVHPVYRCLWSYYIENFPISTTTQHAGPKSVLEFEQQAAMDRMSEKKQAQSQQSVSMNSVCVHVMSVSMDEELLLVSV